MQVNKIQSNQPSFGTKVKMSSNVANIVAGNKNKNKILKQIQALEQNGKDDLLVLTGNGFAKGYGIRGEVTEFFKGTKKELPYMRKLKGDVDIEDLKVSYEQMVNPEYFVWEPKKIKLQKGMEKFFPYLM